MITVNIYNTEKKIKIGEFKTAAKNIRQAFYKHVTFSKYGACATDCYYKLSD